MKVTVVMVVAMKVMVTLVAICGDEATWCKGVLASKLSVEAS